ncbi:radical SAM protein [Rubellimicrobium sp. CFH 75288]|uniref:radical SAM protein n=1 Tax=Rubellimicrobium sp. CFH 75288 TaxID=2697034 RepID=UPI001412F3D0|nr:radical SAM protein [Rubellimicrobium sp. CFH 75288]
MTAHAPRPAPAAPAHLPVARTLSVMLTHKCNAECAHCGTFSGPRVGGRLDLPRLLAAIDQAAALRFGNVVFTGGEPTIYWADLLAGLAHARSRRLMTRVVTNGHWAKTPDRARERLSALVAAGLDEINFSAGDEHQRFVPLEHVLQGVAAALDHPLPVHLMVEKVRDRGITREAVLDHPLLRDRADLEWLGISESPWMPLDPSERADYPEGSCANRDNLDRFPGCDSVLQTYVLHPGGEMTTCCGIGARVIPSLRAEETFDGAPGRLAAIVAEAEEDVLKLWLRHEGPEKILAWAASLDPSIEWEDRYAHRCQACARIYADPRVGRVIAAHYGERLADLVARAFIVEHGARLGEGPWTSRAWTDSGSRPSSARTAAAPRSSP